MIVLHGHGYGDRPVMARAARLAVTGGRVTLDESLLARLVARRDEEVGDLDLVLVAEDAALALLLPLPDGARLVGVVAEKEMAFAPPFLGEISVVAGVADALTLIVEGFLLIVDPARDRVVVEPRAEEVARLQTVHRPRLLLGAEHTPAFTQTGQEVAVWGYCRSLATVGEAIAAGADGIVLEGISDRSSLLQAAAAAGGGDLALVMPPDDLLPDDLLAAAGQSVLHWCLSPDHLSVPVAERRAALKARCLELLLEQPGIAVPRIAALLDGGLPHDPGPYDAAISLSGYVPPDVLDLPPFYVRIDAEASGFPALAGAVGAGAHGVIVDPEHIAAIKDVIRTLD